MTDLHRAMTDLRSIRRQVAQTSEFHGYGPLTLSGTALLAVIAGLAQVRLCPDPAGHPRGYAGLWLATGVIAGAAIVGQMLLRANRLYSGMANEMTRLAVLQFLPAAVAGVAIPLLLLRATPNAAWLLPGLWQVVFSLGCLRAAAACPAQCTWLGCGFC